MRVLVTKENWGSEIHGINFENNPIISGDLTANEAKISACAKVTAS